MIHFCGTVPATGIHSPTQSGAEGKDSLGLSEEKA
jgi:hypothetical protein